MREIIIEEQDDKEGLESLYVRRANYYETDKMGIIHHSNYIRWFEEARLHYMEEMGWPFTKVEAMGIIVPGKTFAYEGIPTFAPEHFAKVRQVDTMKRKLIFLQLLQ